MQQVREMPRPESGTARNSIRTLTRSIGYHIRQLSESWTDMMHRIIDKHGITHGQWRYLRELWEEDGLSQRELSLRVGRQGPTTVSALKLLERSGFARVERSERFSGAASTAMRTSSVAASGFSIPSRKPIT